VDVVTGCQAIANSSQMHVQPVMAASRARLQAANESGMHADRLHMATGVTPPLLFKAFDAS
jgi:hypothetical protein